MAKIRGILFSFFILWAIDLSLANGEEFDRDTASILQMQNQFALQFSNQIIKTEQKANTTHNVFVSPFSLSMALGLLLNATEGHTRTELLQLLNLPVQTPPLLLNEANGQLMDSLASTNSDSFILEIANGIWVDFHFPIHEEYQTLMANYYHAKVTALDFQDALAAPTINRWVSEKTHQKIKEIIEPKDLRSLVMLLANATYFKGQWRHSFPKLATQRDEPFHLWNSGISKVDMMQLSDDFTYMETEALQAIELPYKDSSVSAYVILPKENSYSNFRDVGDTLFSHSFWQKIDTQRQHRHGYLQLPKFRMEYTKELTELLQSMGVKQIFQDDANFTPLTSSGAAVSFILQKTYVNVDEFGTEAAAVTAIGIRATAINGEHPPFEMRVDHPFYFIIREKKTGTLLFVGSLVKP